MSAIQITKIENRITAIGHKIIQASVHGNNCVDLIEQHEQLHRDLSAVLAKRAIRHGIVLEVV